MASQEISAAQKLQQEHAAEGHHVTVEDVVDEDLNPQTGSAAIPDPSVLSEKTAGKQKENAPPPTKSATLDTQSRELFPDLGGPKPQATKAAPKWNVLGGDKTNGQTPVNGTPRTATPTSGLATPTGKSVAPAVHLPGRHVEQIVLEPQHMKSRDQLRRPLKDIIQDINRTSRATIKTVSGTHSGQRFEASGVTQEAAQQALKELVKQIGSVVSGGSFWERTKSMYEILTACPAANNPSPDSQLRSRPHYRPTGRYHQVSAREDWCPHRGPQGRQEHTSCGRGRRS